jgi:TonB family protein
MKCIVLCLAVLVSLEAGFAQGSKRSYFDKDGQPSDVAGSFYYAIKYSSDSSLTYYTSTGTIRSKYIDLGQKKSFYASYFENGNKEEEGRSEMGKRFGFASTWYKNGKPSKIVFYPEQSRDTGPDLVDYWDSLGVKLISNGNGFCRCYNLDVYSVRRELREDGKIVEKVRDSVWTGYIDGKVVFRETYKNGVFTKGIRYRGKEEIFYDTYGEQPEYPGGLNGMMRFLQNNLVYPKDARRSGSQGKVFVGFVVNTDGSLSEIEVVKGVTYSIDKEAKRVVGIMENWKPGVQRGELVRVKYVLPINFKLSR